MANKKQQALEPAKTEARISGIPKGGSTLTGMSEAEKLAYATIGLATSARMIGSSTTGLAKLAKLYKAEKKAGKIPKKPAKVSKKKKISKKSAGTGAALAATAAATSSNQLSKKKYARGGGTRKVRS